MCPRIDANWTDHEEGEGAERTSARPMEDEKEKKIDRKRERDRCGDA